MWLRAIVPDGIFIECDLSSLSLSQTKYT
jgi:hypothetical protein